MGRQDRVAAGTSRRAAGKHASAACGAAGRAPFSWRTVREQAGRCGLGEHCGWLLPPETVVSRRILDARAGHPPTRDGRRRRLCLPAAASHRVHERRGVPSPAARAPALRAWWGSGRFEPEGVPRARFGSTRTSLRPRACTGLRRCPAHRWWGLPRRRPSDLTRAAIRRRVRIHRATSARRSHVDATAGTARRSYCNIIHRYASCVRAAKTKTSISRLPVGEEADFD